MESQPEASPARSLGKPALEEARGDRQIERLPGVHLRLKVGNPIFLRLLCVEQRYEGRVVGFDPYTYFLVQVRLPQDTLAKLPQNPNAIAQLDAGGTLFGFRTEVLNRVSQPAPLLFLSYPEKVERVVLRRNERVKVSVPGNIHGSFGDHDVMVVDLAPEGCRFTARSTLNSPLRTAKPGERVLLRCELGASCGKPFMAPVVLRRVDEQKGRISIGGQFADVAEESLAILREYVQRVQTLVSE
jgi:ABC-type bacteriocin/lantibiotic exporters, contain an N-terminal double-glycine peptidase domain